MASVVLLDLPEGDSGSFDRSFLGRVGHDVAVCHGPSMESVCPLLGGQGCEHFEQAHGIVFSFDLDRPQHRAILDRYRAAGAEGLPMRVVATEAQATRYADALDGLTVWTHQPTVADLDGFAAEVDAFDRS